MSDGAGEIFVVGLILGLLIASILIGAIVGTHEENFYQTEAIARGYAHYDLDHSFHWNNEPKEK